MLDDARTQGVGKILSCGDITGYGYNVGAAFRLLRENAAVHLMGNHDVACLAAHDLEDLGNVPNYDVDRTQRAELSPPDVAWLSRCPYVHAEDGFACTHGDFTAPERFNYVLRYEDAEPSWNVREEPLLFVGHTHAAAVYARGPDGEKETWGPRSFDLRPGWRYLVNVGSVGYPRFDYRITYFIYDSDARRVYFRALPFDLKVYIAGLMERMMPMPPWLTELLFALRRLHETAH